MTDIKRVFILHESREKAQDLAMHIHLLSRDIKKPVEVYCGERMREERFDLYMLHPSALDIRTLEHLKEENPESRVISFGGFGVYGTDLPPRLKELFDRSYPVAMMDEEIESELHSL